MTVSVHPLLIAVLLVGPALGGGCTEDRATRTPTSTVGAAAPTLPMSVTRLRTGLDVGATVPVAAGDRAILRVPIGGDGRPTVTVLGARPHGSVDEDALVEIALRSGDTAAPVGVFRASSSTAPPGEIRVYPGAGVALDTDGTSQLEVSAQLPPGEAWTAVEGVDLEVRRDGSMFTVVIPVVLTMCAPEPIDCADADVLARRSTETARRLLRDAA